MTQARPSTPPPAPRPSPGPTPNPPPSAPPKTGFMDEDLLFLYRLAPFVLASVLLVARSC